MPFILNIDTASEKAAISLANEGKLLGEKINMSPRDHASWVHLAIRELLETLGFEGADLDAIAVVAGPGSYTGLRVGMATAKGLGFALQKPLTTLNTLQVMAKAAARQYAGKMAGCFVPMLDARRAEVFTAVYDENLKPLMPPRALILEKDSFHEFQEKGPLLFFGSGAAKWQAIHIHSAAVFDPGLDREAEDTAQLSYQQYRELDFADLAYSEPFYLKDFHSGLQLN
jgi:tRNA threonylcarbamoyladenosine biosynthesis protein TsaB